MTELRCSVVVPTHDRAESLDRVIGALAAQTLPPAGFEVVVVLDGPSPASVTMLERRRAAGGLPQLRWIEQARAGQAAARNAGAAAARAPVLVFLDDDVVPEPGLLEAHLRHHAAGARIAVLGDSTFVRVAGSYYHMLSWAWWEDLFSERTEPGRPPNLYDFCAGNVSLRRADFGAVGGFDPAFTGYGGEDYEFGHRLLEAGVGFVADRAARAAHHHRATIPSVLRKTRQEAHGDFILVKKHPRLHRTVRMGRPMSRPIRLVARAAIEAPWFFDDLVALMVDVLGWLERASHRHLWLRGFKFVRTYAYWRGVGDALGSWDGLVRFRAAAPPLPAITLDVTAGLPAELPEVPPAGARFTLTAHGRTVGTVVLDGPSHESLRRWIARAVVDQLGVDAARTLWSGPAPWWIAPEASPHG